MLEQRNKGVVMGILLMMHRGLSGQEEICSKFFTTWEEADTVMQDHWEEYIDKNLDPVRERWLHDIFTVIMTDEGIELSHGAGQQTTIGEEYYAYPCTNCGKDVWENPPRQNEKLEEILCLTCIEARDKA